MRPLGDDGGWPKREANGSLISIAVSSTVIALIICTAAAWLLLLKFRDSDYMTQRYPHSAIPNFSGSSGAPLFPLLLLTLPHLAPHLIWPLLPRCPTRGAVHEAAPQPVTRRMTLGGGDTAAQTVATLEPLVIESTTNGAGDLQIPAGRH